ncbi:MAG: hypothetical protein IT365_19140 [Candidatus Hydrogenedentes bacterium]|nr:hypothetical protein [Candidatus Hydrogenedentota bacterium]
MNRHNSSISNSEPSIQTRLRTNAKAALWAVFFLFLMDVSVNLLFPYPGDPHAMPNAVQRYFEYGRSTEAKLERLIGPTDETTAPIGFAGWLNPDDWASQPQAPAQPDGILMAVYGMSFAADVGNAVCEMDPRFTMRFIGGPSAPPNFVYAAYELDRGKYPIKVAVLGILASSLRGMDTLTGITMNFEQPYPFTYPIYRVQGGALYAEWPAIRSLPELRSALADPVRWNTFVEQLATHDRYYSPLLFERTPLDHSAIVRMARRAWAQRRDLQIVESLHDGSGFKESAPAVPVLRAILRGFAKSCTAEGVIPFVYLVNDRGYSDHLYRLLAPTLDSEGINYVSTHIYAPSDNPANFIGDGHFTEAANTRIAEAMHGEIFAELQTPLAEKRDLLRE